MSTTGVNRYQALVNAMHTILHTSSDEGTRNYALSTLRAVKEIPDKAAYNS